ncbi:GNAT family N-acetyltransferase [Chitinophaga sp. S165]|uniref:GNAT family N-acetyltransferase n=1 Tax=Chitinophaga sp. S165 TaxID=2135462 RepID=UPI000D715913|nr:GNAT family N-acetyltransferase [Chitinophaga sp. S165]PWV53328.1 acetyltransferase (GNAT) family protein [Chitinophaga sp. S165]
MYTTKFISSEDELRQVAEISRLNSEDYVTDDIKAAEGYTSWKYTFEDLKALHEIAPSVVVKDGERVVGYLLVLVKASAAVYEPLTDALKIFDGKLYNGKPFLSYNVYFLGQTCIDINYRGQGLLRKLYQFHKDNFESVFDFALSAIARDNPKSLAVHTKLGFRTLFPFTEGDLVWDAVMWDFNMGE